MRRGVLTLLLICGLWLGVARAGTGPVDLSVTLRASTSMAGVGDTVSYTAAVRNRGPDAAVRAGVGIESRQDRLCLGIAEPDGVGVAAGAQMLDAGGGENRTRLAWEFALPPPSSSKAAGTTSRPRMTVTTKASAPHSWSQKARDELRIRVLRPSPVAVCFGC